MNPPLKYFVSDEIKSRQQLIKETYESYKENNPNEKYKFVPNKKSEIFYNEIFPISFDEIYKKELSEDTRLKELNSKKSVFVDSFFDFLSQNSNSSLKFSSFSTDKIEDEKSKIKLKYTENPEIVVKNFPSNSDPKNYYKFTEKLNGRFKGSSVRQGKLYVYFGFETHENAEKAIREIDGHTFNKVILKAEYTPDYRRFLELKN